KAAPRARRRPCSSPECRRPCASPLAPSLSSPLLPLLKHEAPVPADAETRAPRGLCRAGFCRRELPCDPWPPQDLSPFRVPASLAIHRRGYRPCHPIVPASVAAFPVMPIALEIASFTP